MSACLASEHNLTRPLPEPQSHCISCDLSRISIAQKLRNQSWVPTYMFCDTVVSIRVIETAQTYVHVGTRFWHTLPCPCSVNSRPHGAMAMMMMLIMLMMLLLMMMMVMVMTTTMVMTMTTR